MRQGMEAVDSTLPEMRELWLQTLNWQPSLHQQAQFQQLFELILAGNQQLNLTRITQPEEFWEKHLWDSLRGVKLLLADTSQPLKVLDIGTGAGFPGVPVAIAFPHSRVTLLDSIHKKVKFLEALVTQMGLTQVNPLVGRAEGLNQVAPHRQEYDLVLIRAVKDAATCVSYSLPFLKSGGLAVLYRGHWTSEEAVLLEQQLKGMKATWESTEEFTTPLSQGVRHCLYLRKL